MYWVGKMRQRLRGSSEKGLNLVVNEQQSLLVARVLGAHDLQARDILMCDG